MRRIHIPQAIMLILLLVTTWLYGPAVKFGFIWDDPLWYGRMVGKSVGELVSPMPDYHFYRPALVLQNRLFLNPGDTVAVPLLHAVQIGWHLLNVALTFALCRRLGLGSWTAVATGILVASYPFSYQAVAWAAPAQPLATALQNGAWLAYLRSRRGRESRRAVALSLLLFTTSLFVQEGTALLAGMPLIMEWGLRSYANRTRRTVPWLALAYPLIAVGFGLLWLTLPRQAGYTVLDSQPSAIAYFAQGLVFPLLGRPGGYDPGQTIAPAVLLVVAGTALGGLLAAAWRAGRGRQALLGLAWALLGIAPSALGLRYSYVKVGSRLFYYAAPGVAMLWACALLPPTNHSPARCLRRTVGIALFILIVAQSSLLLVGFRRMYAVGTAHLAELIESAQAGEARMLFVNFPDRYTPKRPPYPIGYWGITLAPVSVDLGAFPAITTGQHPQTASRSMPWIDADARDTGPYQVDMRGVVAQPDQLYQLARGMDTVYLSRYHPDGTFTLQQAGAVTQTSFADPAGCRLAVFSQTLCLQSAEVDTGPDRLEVTLTWFSLAAAQPHDTVFVHLGLPDQPPIAQADGDAWLGMVPLTIWEPGDVIRERRIIPLPAETPSGLYAIRVGVYNRLTGERLPATTPQGDPLPGNSVTIDHPPPRPSSSWSTNMPWL
jgi:hypothetical protein